MGKEIYMETGKKQLSVEQRIKFIRSTLTSNNNNKQASTNAQGWLSPINLPIPIYNKLNQFNIYHKYTYASFLAQVLW